MLLKEFSTIFDRPEKVKKLREYILSLAVRGKLVKQDENDEPASVLLELLVVIGAVTVLPLSTSTIIGSVLNPLTKVTS